MGEDLKNFSNFTMELTADLRGMSIGNSEFLRVTHNSFSKPEPFVFQQTSSKGGKDDVFHFISYIPHKGKVYELDGLQEGPILLGDIVEGVSWLEIVKSEINKRIQHYSSNEIRFALLALIKSKKSVAEESLLANESNYHSYLRKLKELQGDNFDSSIYGDVDESKISGMDLEINMDAEGLMAQLIHLKVEVTMNQTTLDTELEKKKRYEKENARRKHNYIPFILEMLKITAEKGDLSKYYDEAKSKVNTSQGQKP